MDFMGDTQIFRNRVVLLSRVVNLRHNPPLWRTVNYMKYSEDVDVIKIIKLGGRLR